MRPFFMPKNRAVTFQPIAYACPSTATGCGGESQGETYACS